MYYIDIPDQYETLKPEGSWVNVNTVKTKHEAIEWIRENIGWCDDEGRICLITEGQDNDDWNDL
jgi:hypothetical protein